jgi:hypothetical protein
MRHITQIQLNPDSWTQYSGWFYVKNYGPKDYVFDASTGVLTLFNTTVINHFFQHHPNLPYTLVSHSDGTIK